MEVDLLNPGAMKTLRDAWAAGESTYGAWLSVPSSVSAELAAGVGFDYVCIDCQHGGVEYQPTIAMIQAIALGGSNPIVRVPWNEPGIIGKSLDAGAQGVIVPMVNTAAQAAAAVAACRYAPAGSRSYGPTVVGMRHDAYTAWAADNIAVIVMIETAEAVANLDEILAVPGIDAVYVGPADLSLTLGLPPKNNDGAPAFDDALARIVAACQKAGIVPGAHSVGGIATRRAEQGFRLLTVSADLIAMRQSLGSDLAAAKA